VTECRAGFRRQGRDGKPDGECDNGIAVHEATPWFERDIRWSLDATRRFDRARQGAGW
jgi:hypothetical protein